jgi:hypothetical protein
MKNTPSNRLRFTTSIRAGASRVPRITAVLSALWLTLLSPATPSQAADGDTLWGSSGIKLAEQVSPHSAWSGGIVSDASGGAIAVWTDCLDLNPATYSAMLVAQRLDASGAKLWAGGGAGNYISTKATCHDPAIIADGAGGVVVVWWIGQTGSGGQVYAQRLDASGVRQWGASDVQVGSAIGTAGGPTVVSDAIGGAFVGWAHRLAHVQAGGTVDAPGIDGIELIPGSDPNTYKMIGDGTGGGIPTPVPGGVFAAWSTPAGQLMAQRVNAGLRWGSAGLTVATHGAILGYDLARDGAGGLLLCWVATDGTYPYRYTVRAQRLDVNGNALWNPGGVIVIDSDVVGGSYTAPDYSAPAIATDGGGGAIIAWCDTRNWSAPTPPGSSGNARDLYAQRVDAGGGIVWTPSGVLLPPYLYGSVAPGDQGAPRIVPDTRNGAVVAYDDLGGWSWDIAGTRLNGNGTRLWSKWIRSDGTSGADPGLTQNHVQIAFDASGAAPQGALLVWDETEGGHHRVYAQKVTVDLTTQLPPANDLCAGAVVLTDNLYHSQSTTNATDDGLSACLGRTRTKGVWFRYTATQTGTATVDTCPSDFDTNLEIFSGSCGTPVAIACNEDSSSCAGYWQGSVSFPCVAGTVYLIYAGGYNGQSGNLQIRARAFTTLANDDCAGAFALSENVYYAENTANAGDDGVSACLGRTRTKGVWFTFTPTVTGKATVDTCPTDFDTNLEIFTGGCGGLTSIACNEDSAACAGYWQAWVSFPCTAQTQYHIYAGGYNGQSGNLQVRVRTPFLYWSRGAGSGLNLSWKTGYILQTTPTLTSPAWTDVSDVVNTNGPTTTYSVTTTNATRFFRLR